MKGAPISILVAYIINKQVMTLMELQQWTGYKGDTLTAAVRQLETEGWLTSRSSRGPWGLAEGRQFPLMAEIDQFSASQFPDSEKIGVELPTTTTTMVESKKNKLVAVIVEDTTPKKSESIIVYETPGVTFEKNLFACKKYNIGQPKADIIASCPWVSPEFIKSHVEALRDGDTLGLAIRRIEGNEAPPGQKNPVSKERASYEIPQVDTNYEHEDDCNCFQCRRDYPERFCSYAGKPCGSLVIPGQRFCSKHLESTSNKTSESE
jgi:hypothetical protein